MAFHDTRTKKGGDIVLSVMRKHFAEIESAELNRNNSNITLLRKRSRLEYENWNIAEGRKDWQTGAAEPDLAELNALLNR